MTEKPHASQEREFSEAQSSLWRITFGPLIWGTHFLVAYSATAVFCEKWPAAEAHIDLLRIGIGVATVLALVGIVWVGWQAWRQWDYLDDYDYSHPAGKSEDRHEFLGHAAFLLAILSFVGVIYTALPAIFAGTCQ